MANLKTSKSKELINKFPERYHLIVNGDGYCLYDKEAHSPRSRYKYLGFITLDTNKGEFVFNDSSYKDIESLINAINEYNSTLPFDPDIYNPSFKESYRIQMATHDYLCSLGFKSDDSDAYTLKDGFGQPVVSVFVKVNHDSKSGYVIRTLGNSAEVECPFKDLDSAIAAINSVVGTYIISLQSTITVAINKLTGSRQRTIEIGFVPHSLDVYAKDITNKTIELLQSELEKLKQL